MVNKHGGGRLVTERGSIEGMGMLFQGAIFFIFVYLVEARMREQAFDMSEICEKKLYREEIVAAYSKSRRG